MATRVSRAPAWLLLLAPLSAQGSDPIPDAEPPLFANVTAEVGLEGVPAKDCILADLDGDGFWDLCLDRRRLYLSRSGARFELLEEPGIDFPVVRQVPLSAEGRPDQERAREPAPYVPHHLYFADLDNDGAQDAVWGVEAAWQVVGSGGWTTVEECDPGVRSAVWLGVGGGRFERAPDSPFGGDEACGPAMALAICDFDADGRLDVFEGRQYRQYGMLAHCGVDRLWKGDGKGRFVDVTEAAGLLTVPEPGGPRSSRPTYGVTSADVDNDGRPDLLQLAYGRQWNYLWRNQGDGTFTEIGRSSGFAGDEITHGRYPDWVDREAEAPFRSNGNTFDCAVGDYDNDGDLDLFLGEIAHAWAGEASDLPSLLVNQGAEGGWAFERIPVTELLPSRPSREPQRYNFGDMHVAWLDYDNDTRLDLLIGSGDYPDGQFLRLYRQDEDGGFEEVTREAGFDWEGCGGLSIGDFDRDGDVDVLVGRSFMRLNQAHRDRYMGGIRLNEVGLFQNRLADRNGNHWLNVRLEGKGRGGANRGGIGARVSVTTGELTQIREIRSGSGLANHQDPPEACFGLGSAERVDRLEVRWPDAKGSRQVFEDLEVDRFVTAVQGRRAPRIEPAASGR